MSSTELSSKVLIVPSKVEKKPDKKYKAYSIIVCFSLGDGPFDVMFLSFGVKGNNFPTTNAFSQNMVSSEK
jgi:hypothetical protein